MIVGQGVGALKKGAGMPLTNYDIIYIHICLHIRWLTSPKR